MKIADNAPVNSRSLFGLFLLAFSGAVLVSVNTGKVTGVSMASTVAGTYRAGTVQFSIEGGLVRQTATRRMQLY
jgi:hypothetical protein